MKVSPLPMMFRLKCCPLGDPLPKGSSASGSTGLPAYTVDGATNRTNH